MSNAPRIWLDYRPVRVGWAVAHGDVVQLCTAASWSTCLWGGRFNPIIPIEDRELSDNLIRTFGVDVVVPIEANDLTRDFVNHYPYLHLTAWGKGVFNDQRCEFVDIRHAVRRAATVLNARPQADVSPLARPTWALEDPMSPLFTALFGRYPDRDEIGVNYLAGIRDSIPMPDRSIDLDAPIPGELVESISPIDFTALDISSRNERFGRVEPGVVLGDATNFDDLLLFWNLRAAGATVAFLDRNQTARCKPFVDAFLALVRATVVDDRKRLNFWGRDLYPPYNPAETGLDLDGLQISICGAGDAVTWNGGNVRPGRATFSTWHRDVVASYSEDQGRATASFSLPDRPFNEDDPRTFNQQFVVTVDANQYSLTSDDLTFETP